MPLIRIVGADEAPAAGTVVVVDVIRAFTTATAAVGAGADQVLCVDGVDDALALRARLPTAVLAGEDGGRRIPGFPLANSPVEAAAADLRDATVVLRTTNGTRGLVRAAAAHSVLAMAATNVAATAGWIVARAPSMPVTIVCTDGGDEDLAAAEHLVGLLEETGPDPALLAERVRRAGAGRVAGWGPPRPDDDPDGFLADVAACARVDAADVALVGRRAGAAVALTPVQVVV